VDGTRLISTGNMIAQSGQMYAFNGGVNFNNFFLGGEYAHFDIDREAVAGGPTVDHPNFDGWYVEGSWVITGEPKTYTVSATNNEVGGFGAPRVANPFSLSGDSWGAWELTARYSDTDLNWHETIAPGIRGGQERIFLVGVNWYMNQNIKLQVNDMFVNVDKLNAALPAGIDIGQNLNILGVRLQFSN
jgi:phosphate-selective porin OprO/OprP